MARKGLGESQFRRGAYTVVLFICTYFVSSTHGVKVDVRYSWGGGGFIEGRNNKMRKRGREIGRNKEGERYFYFEIP